MTLHFESIIKTSLLKPNLVSNTNMRNESFDVDLYFLRYDISHASTVISLEVFLCVLNSIVALTGTIENLLLLLAIWRTSSLHSPANMILCSLAISDFVNGLIVQPAMVIHLISEICLSISVHIIAGIIWETCAAITAAVSMLCVMLLSFDRYLALRFHLRYNGIVTNKRVIIVAAIVWISQCLMSGFRFIENANKAFLIITILMIESSFLCIFFTNLKVFQTVRRHQNTINKQVHAVSQGGSHPIVNLVTFKKTAITMSYIVGTFCLFYFPFNGALIGYIITGHQTTAVRVAYYICATVGISSSCVNPLICFYRIRDVRRAVLRLIRRFRRSVSPADISTGVQRIVV